MVEGARSGHPAASSRPSETRRRWLEVMARHQHDPARAATADYWSPTLDCASRDALAAIQQEKLAAAVPFLYENSAFYRRRFARLGMTPDDLTGLDDLPKWPVIDKAEMMDDVLAHPPYGTFTCMDDALWAERGWMLFSSSGSTGTPRVFRYSQRDREMWSWANARALHAMGFRPGDTVFLISGFGPHVWMWGVQNALELMGIPAIPGGGMDAKARAGIIQRFQPTAIACTVSYALYLGRIMQDLGHDPAASSVQKLFIGGEPGAGIPHTRQRLEALWGARVVEFYGCTEAAPHVGGFSCPAVTAAAPFAHLMEDVQVWETVDPDTRAPVADGQRGLTVCTNLNTESSPQLRFLVGDYTVLNRSPCACGRTHVRALGGFAGRADELINLRGIKMYPVQIEEAVRAVPGVGDEYEIVIAAGADGLDRMTIRIEHGDAAVGPRVGESVRTHCEVRVDIEVLAPGSLPRTEFKAKRIRDTRQKS
ncbi:MAG: AMP-binding protein [Alphaproteobacteria bacterium]|nr:AMP-binding protein [Alphaproteobacteria bacterium]